MAIRQMLKGLKNHPEMWLTPKQMQEQMERVKWFLWHGNTYQALQILQVICEPLEICFDQKNKYSRTWKAVDEFLTYIENNRSFIPNYGERYRHNERISTGFVESAVNQVINKRFAKKQQMRWTRCGHIIFSKFEFKFSMMIYKRFFENGIHVSKSSPRYRWKQPSPYFLMLSMYTRTCFG